MSRVPETIYNPVNQERVTFIQSAVDSEDQAAVVEIQLGPRAKGPPLHYHLAHTETFAPIVGELCMRLGTETIRLRPGQQVTAEIGQRHTFWSEADEPVTFRGTLKPANDDVEKCFRISFGLARDGLCTRSGVPKNLYHLAILTAMSQSRGVGILGVVMSLLERVASLPRCRAVQEELVRKYCPPRSAGVPGAEKMNL